MSAWNSSMKRWITSIPSALATFLVLRGDRLALRVLVCASPAGRAILPLTERLLTSEGEVLRPGTRRLVSLPETAAGDFARARLSLKDAPCAARSAVWIS